MQKEELLQRIEELKNNLNIAEKRARLQELQKKLEDPDLWSDWKKGQKISKKVADLERDLELFEQVEKLKKSKKWSRLEEVLEELEMVVYLSGKHDEDSAILSIHAGQGGTEAMDWAQMLKRMYQRYAENQGWSVTVLDESLGEEAGIKSTTTQIEGDYAYGYLKGESGVHRLVRQSPFNADNLRHTSFALVEVIPVLDKDIDVEIIESDLEVETFGASGPGGQHMQKSETAVRVKHKPTGLTAVSQASRSQSKNRESAMSLLRSKLYNLERKKRQEKEEELRGGYKVPGWGNQIRSYVLHPYKLVKDLRTDVESHQPEDVLDGKLQKFVEAELKQHVTI